MWRAPIGAFCHIVGGVLTGLRGVAALVGLLIGLLHPPAGTGAAESSQGEVPRGWRRVVWQGIAISYNPAGYVFSETRPGNARAAARLDERADPCQDANVADCGRGYVRLRLYPTGGVDVRTWVAHNAALVGAGFARNFTDTIIGGRQAAMYIVPADLAPSVAYAVPVGSEVLVIEAVPAEQRLVTLLQFTQPRSEQLAVGQVAMTRPARTWDLWTQAVGGVRVFERPKLYGGSLLTILAIGARAVQVRTSEGVTGWIRAAAPTVLTARSAQAGETTPFMQNGWTEAQIVHPRGIALREVPRSTARRLGDPLKRGERVQVLGVRGDWLRVHHNGSFGWARWYYDGARYIEAVGR